MPDCQIGIIVPSFRDERIAHTILSIVMLDHNNLTRIYILDGGSPDGILKTIKAYLRPHDILVSERDKGIFDALNKGLDMVAEPYFGWLGSDDFYTSSVNFAEIVERFTSERLDCMIFGTAFIDDFKVRRSTAACAPTIGNYTIGRLIPHFSSFWRTATVGSLRFSLDHPIAADMDFFVRLVKSRQLRSCCKTQIGTIMRLGGASTGGAKRILMANWDTFRIFTRYMGHGVAAFAVGMKLFNKTLSLLFFFRQPVPLTKELTSAIIRTVT
tara:strand:- start:801 stop:1610 length:810 start_codon:yes stop_codon:yes gene_type:complete